MRRGLLPWALAGLAATVTAGVLALLEFAARGSGGGLLLRLAEGLVALAAALGMAAMAWLQRTHEGIGRALEEVRRQVITDKVTGLAGRRYLDRRLEEEISLARRYGRPLALLMLDLDNFKDVNDRLGHRAGDQVLEEVGHAIQQGVRSTDVAARYGGDEFAILLPDTGRQGAAALAQRLESAIEALDLPAAAGSPPLGLGLSWGVAQYPEDGATAPELLLSADRALYQAKRRRSR